MLIRAGLPLLRSHAHTSTACKSLTAITASAAVDHDPSLSLLGTAVADIASAGAAVVVTATGFLLLAAFVALGSWLSYEQYVLSLRSQRFKRGAGNSTSSQQRSRSVEPWSPAYVPPREYWRLAELREYDGTQSPDGAILVAAEGFVYNVAKARNFYGPGGEYAVMGGTDASRLLAKNTVEPETEAEAAVPLNLAERASLSAWVLSFRQKYDCVGRFISEEEAARRSEAMQRNEEYYDRLEEISVAVEAREQLEAAWRGSGDSSAG